MDRPGKDLAVPEDLEYLALEVRGRDDLDLPRELDRRERLWVVPPAISGAATTRLTKLANAELAQREIGFVRPAWLGDIAIPRFVVYARYEGLDAFGVARTLARVDLAARRAVSLQRQLVSRGSGEKWPEPMRSHQGGMRLLDVRLGSCELLMTAWGGLVAVAGSAPISVASLFALAWDLGRGGVYLRNRWIGRGASGPRDERPTLAPLDEATPWGLDHTKALSPVLEKAIKNDQGAEFYLKDGDRELKLVVYPRD